MDFYRKNRNALFISVLILLSLAISLYYMPSAPLLNDEAVYAEMIDEFIRTPTLVPHFMGHVVSWKPILGFATYAIFISGFHILNPAMPVEFLYRFPSIIFGVLSAVAVYFIGRKFYGEEVALLSAVIFAVNPVSVVLNESLLLENLTLFLLLSGVLLYIEGERDRKYLYYGGFLGALLFLTKSIMAFLLPALAVAYYLGNRKMGNYRQMGKSFLLSLAGVPLAMLLYSLVFFMSAPAGQGADARVMYIYDAIRVWAMGGKPVLLLNSIEFLKLSLPWSIMFFAGLLAINLRKREDRFIFIWLVLMLVFLGAGQFYSRYYLPLVPPFSIICARAFMQVRDRKFFLPLLLLLLFASTPDFTNPAFMSSNIPTAAPRSQNAQVGFFLRNKSGILSITTEGIPETVFYKFHGESAPNYTGFEMKVLNPASSEGYIAYRTISEIALELAPTINLTDSQQVKSWIGNSSNNAYVVMDSDVYRVYSSSPLRNYSVVFNSSQGGPVVLGRVT